MWIGRAVGLVFLPLIFGQEDVYQHYMQAQQEQMQMPVESPRRGGLGITTVTGLLASAFAAGHFSPFSGKNAKKSQKELERLYQIISAKNVEVQKLKTMVYEYEYRNQELKQALYESEQDTLKRDYEEFKQPDANGDDVISRAEVAHFLPLPFVLLSILTFNFQLVRDLYSQLHEGLPAHSS
jgi:hypothetical protein